VKRGFDWRGAVAFAAIVALIAFIAWGMWATVRPAAGGELRKGELELLSRIVQTEASGESAEGQRAVAWTSLNRLRAGIYGKTLTDVLRAPHQYAHPARVRDSPAYREALHAASQAVLGAMPDDSRGSTHFARCDVRPRPAWVRRFELRATHGAHCFYRRR
jgi:spore germination cell wall hydrolase CwlJ-like protein